MYDVIVFGAGFAAAGIAKVCKKRCLVLERRMEAGYEFFGALNFGTSYNVAPKQKEAEEMQKQFCNNASPYENSALLYPIFKQCDIYFGTEIVSVEPGSEGFLCTTHGVEGYQTFTAKTIVDTRSIAKNCSTKTFNLLIESKETPEFEGISWKRADADGRVILQIPVPLSCTFYEARKIALEIIEKFSPTQKLILSANEFDYKISASDQDTDGIRALPSKAYDNPILAYEAGLIFGKELIK